MVKDFDDTIDAIITNSNELHQYLNLIANDKPLEWWEWKDSMDNINDLVAMMD